MFLLASVALGGAVNLGWPCSRMNWAWRNVWSACSINSYVPTAVGTNDHPPAHYRAFPLSTTESPNILLGAGGFATPAASGNLPTFFCDNLANTGFSGPSKTLAEFPYLRNRCRRAIDAYGGIVKACQLTPDKAGVPSRGVVGSFPDFAPAAAHQPHVSNVVALTAHATHCYQQDARLQPASPHATCPGLLGWFTVVWHACNLDKALTTGFTTKTASVPEAMNAITEAYPLGGVFTPRIYSHETLIVADALTGPSHASAPKLQFCSPGTAAFVPSATAWNVRGPVFRTTRCRKALDQFGRTANRCGGPNVAGLDAPSTGSGDKLRVLFHTTVAASEPSSLYRLVPMCN